MDLIFKKCPCCGHLLTAHSRDCGHCHTADIDDWARTFVVGTLFVLVLVIAFIVFKNFL